MLKVWVVDDPNILALVLLGWPKNPAVLDCWDCCWFWLPNPVEFPNEFWNDPNKFVLGVLEPNIPDVVLTAEGAPNILGWDVAGVVLPKEPTDWPNKPVEGCPNVDDVLTWPKPTK